MADDDKLKVGVELEVENVNIKSDKIKKSMKSFNKEFADSFNVNMQNIFNERFAKASYHSMHQVLDPFFKRLKKEVYGPTAQKILFSNKGLGEYISHAYNQEQIRQRVLGNIKQYGAGSKSLQSRTKKAFGHLGFLSQSLLGNDYEARLKNEAIRDYVFLSNATLPIKNKNITKGLLTQDYINQSLGINKSPELEKLSRFYSEQEKNTKSKLQSILQESSYSGLGSKYESNAIKNIKKQDSFEEKQRQKESRELLKKQKEEEKKKEKYRKEVTKRLTNLSDSFLGFVKKAGIATLGSATAGGFLYKNWSQGATETALQREVLASTIGGQYVPGIQNWASLFRVYGGVSREQSYGLFKNLQAQYGKYLMGDAGASRAFGALGISQLSGNPIDTLRQLIHGFRGLDKATRMDVANQLGINDNMLLAIDKLNEQGFSGLRNLFQTNLNESETRNLSNLGEDIRTLSETWKNFKDIFVAHSDSLNNWAKNASELLRKGIKVIRDKGDPVKNIWEKFSENAFEANPYLFSYFQNFKSEDKAEHLKSEFKRKQKFMNFMKDMEDIREQGYVFPLEEFIGNNFSKPMLDGGFNSKNISFGDIVLNIEAPTKADGNIDGGAIAEELKYALKETLLDFDNLQVGVR